ncbi:hypothetical protein [Chelativorans sp. M5D2P16]|uniref:hypothetical protein n=1 Tax=Chelativorans sp. M5D2P16 TaxID=3095678 RepID=UPI002ACAA3B6|nr:hypothetical protein [Chelativorans sp. M5D2P16]MDZ5698150.1 hypothetical protein [Chelativorans sp. M5D2P16]
MSKFLTGLVSAAALFGLAACGDADETTTQSVEPDPTEQTAPLDEPATGADDTTTQGLEPDTGEDTMNQ